MCRMGVAVLEFGSWGLLVPVGAWWVPAEATRAAVVV